MSEASNNHQHGTPYKVDEAAAALNVSRHTIRAWIAQERLRAVRFGRSVRVPIDEIERVLQHGIKPRTKT